MNEATEFTPEDGPFDPETADDVTVRNPDTPEREAIGNPEREAAEKRGWTDRETFEADPKNEGKTWVDFAEFNRRGELFDAIGQLKKDNRELREAQSGFKDLLFTQQRESYERGRREAEQALDAAVEKGDSKAAREAADTLASLTEPSAPPQQQRDWTAEFASANPWYGKHEVATRLAQQLDSELAREIPNDELRLQIVAERVQSMTDVGKPPANPNRDRPAETGANRRASGRVQYTEKDLTPGQRQTLKQLNAVLPRGEQMTAHEYRTQLEEAFGNG